MSTHACVCVTIQQHVSLAAADCWWGAVERTRLSIVLQGINRIPIKRCTICNMRQISSNEITGIKMDEIEQRDGKEASRRIEQSLIRLSEHLLTLNQADLYPRTLSTLCFSWLYLLGEVLCWALTLFLSYCTFTQLNECTAAFCCLEPDTEQLQRTN